MTTPRCSLTLIAFLCVVFLAPPAQAQKPLPEETRAQLDDSIESVRVVRVHLAELEQRANETEGVRQQVLLGRIAKNWELLFETALGFVTSVADQEEAGFDVSAYRDPALRVLERLPDELAAATARVAQQLELPAPDASAAELAAADFKLGELSWAADRHLRARMRHLEVAQRLGLDVSQEQEKLAAALANRAAASSVFLDLAATEQRTLDAQLAVLPEDAELKAKRLAADNRLAMTAGVLESTVNMMKVLELDTADYEGQIIAATGQLTTDILDPKVLGGLITSWAKDAGALVVERGPAVLMQLGIFALIVLVFRYLSRISRGIVKRGLDVSGADIPELARTMLLATVGNLVLVTGILIALSQVGISLGPVLAGLGIAGFVIGFALQDSLSNFASGMMILIYRPFDVGDLVNAGGVFGKVNHMSLVNTTFLTIDNQTVVVPNTKIWSDVITNVGAQDLRRVDLVFGISYGDDIPKAERVLEAIVKEHKLVLDEPALMIKVAELADSSVNFIVRPWCKTDDYWDVHWDLTREVKLRFDQEGISIPFPQRELHVRSAVPPGAA